MSVRINQLKSKLLAKTGLINWFWHRLPNDIYVFNYHRIGNKQDCIYDRAIFSCDAELFEQQLIAIKQNFTVINAKQLAELIKQQKPLSERYAVLTFDDGYIDNYQVAFPLLLKHQLTASFYLTNDFVEAKRIPWWDEVAFLLRHADGKRLQFSELKVQMTIAHAQIEQQILQLVNAFKQHKSLTVMQLAARLKQYLPEQAKLLLNHQEPLFLSWQQAQEMLQQGMDIGCHSQTHRILSQLSSTELAQEITEAKSYLELQLKTDITTFAYPVGRYYCFNHQVIKQVADAGFVCAFNNEVGSNDVYQQPFNINRLSVAFDNLAYFKWVTCFGFRTL